MAVTLKSGLVQVEWNTVAKNALDLETPESFLKRLVSFSFTNGSGDDQAHAHWSDERTLGATTAETLDLTALANGPYGTVVFTDIRAILIVNTSTAGQIFVGNAAADAWDRMTVNVGERIVIPPGGAFLWMANRDAQGVVSGTRKNVKIDNPAGSSQTYRILILGTTS